MTVDFARVNVLDVGIHNITRDQTLVVIERMIESGETHLITTPNVDYLVKAQRDHEFRAILNSSALTLPDGMGVVYASYFLGTPLSMNVGGRLVIPALCGLGARRGYRVYLLGSAPGVADRAAERLLDAYRGLKVSGTRHGFFSRKEEAEVISSVRRSASDVLVLALGTPKQEKWMAMHHRDLNVPVVIGVGSTLDRISGDVSSPPTWMTTCGFEWLYRIFQEPKRLGRRYLVEDPVFFKLLVQQRLQASGKRGGARWSS